MIRSHIGFSIAILKQTHQLRLFSILFKANSMTDPPISKTTAYWRENIRIVLMLLAVWFIVSYGMGILFADSLDKIQFFGFRFGFWMAQQGSIFCFVILIFVYVYKMNKLDHKYNVDEDKDDFVPDEDYYHLDDESNDSASKK